MHDEYIFTLDLKHIHFNALKHTNFPPSIMEKNAMINMEFRDNRGKVFISDSRMQHCNTYSR